MINAALIENDTVTNIIYIDQANIELFAAAGMEIVDSAPLGMTMGDIRVDGSWYREVGGELLPLPIEREAV